jgi:hypothetical protein
MKRIRLVALLVFCSIFVVGTPALAQQKKPGKESKPKAQGTVQPTPAQAPDAEKEKKEEKFRGMKYRLIGPFRGGRSLTGVGIPGDPKVYYFGATEKPGRILA